MDDNDIVGIIQRGDGVEAVHPYPGLNERGNGKGAVGETEGAGIGGTYRKESGCNVVPDQERIQTHRDGSGARRGSERYQALGTEMESDEPCM